MRPATKHMARIEEIIVMGEVGGGWDGMGEDVWNSGCGYIVGEEDGFVGDDACRKDWDGVIWTLLSLKGVL